MEILLPTVVVGGGLPVLVAEAHGISSLGLFCIQLESSLRCCSGSPRCQSQPRSAIDGTINHIASLKFWFRSPGCVGMCVCVMFVYSTCTQPPFCSSGKMPALLCLLAGTQLKTGMQNFAKFWLDINWQISHLRWLWRVCLVLVLLAPLPTFSFAHPSPAHRSRVDPDDRPRPFLETVFLERIRCWWRENK